MRASVGFLQLVTEDRKSINDVPVSESNFEGEKNERTYKECFDG
jgi:hypothetical protein